MAESSPSPTRLVLEDHPGLGRISVDMEAFFEFSFWIAEELEDLKAQALHNDAINARNHSNREDALRNNRHRAG